MATRAQKTKVGLFLLGSLTLAAVGIFLISGLRTESRTEYWVHFTETVSGLGIGGLVDYRGVPVGSVESIVVGPENQAQVKISVIDERVRLREGVTAQLVMTNLATGAMAISLRGGDPGAPPLAPNSLIPVESSLFESLTTALPAALNALSGVLEKVSRVADALELSVSGMEEGVVAKTVKNIEAITEDSQDFMAHTRETMDSLSLSVQRAVNEYAKLGEDLRYLAEDLGETVEKTNGLVDTARAKIEPLDLQPIQEDLEVTLRNVRQLTDKAAGTLNVLERVGQTAAHQTDNIQHAVRESLESFNEALDALTVLAARLREDPASLIRGPGKPKPQE